MQTASNKAYPQRQQARFGSCLLPCTERALELPSKCCAFVRLEAYSVTALAVAKAHLLGDMPKRHVGYAQTLILIQNIV